MAVDDLDVLHEELPQLFRPSELRGDWDESYVFVPLPQPVIGIPADLADFLDDLERTRFDFPDMDVSDSISPFEFPTTILGDFPGAPDASVGAVSGVRDRIRTGRTGIALSPPQPPDCLAFYLPFHYFHPTWWGIYLTVEGTLKVATFIHDFDPGRLSFEDAYLAAQAFLYGHEYYHHKVEAFAAKLEVTHREPLYRTSFETLFQAGCGTSNWLEEILATAFGHKKAQEPFKKKKAKQRAVAAALAYYIDQLPVGYREAADVLSDSRRLPLEREFVEANQRAAFPSKSQQDRDVWLLFPHALRGISCRTSRVNYIVRTSSPLASRAGLSLHYFRHQDVAKELRSVGCVLVRQGKGSHEIWHCPNGNTVTVPRHPGDLRAGTLHNIRKTAGVG